MKKIYILGETTYDIIFKNEKPVNAKVGGSQLNTSISLGRLGLPVNFITQFGTDKIGDISDRFLNSNSVQTTYVSRYDGNSRISLAFLDENNNAEYTFLDSKNSVKTTFPEISSDDIILFGSSYSIKKDIRDDLTNFLRLAKDRGAIIIYDPNFRKSNISKLNKVMPYIMENISFSHIIKGSDDDFENIFGLSSASEVWIKLRELGVQNLIYTANKNEVEIYNNQIIKQYKVPRISPISTIGAGDNFNAGIIYTLFKNNINNKNLTSMQETDWDEIIKNSICFAQEVCMSYDNYISTRFAEKYISNCIHSYHHAKV